MSLFICPVCGEKLEKNDKTYFCRNNHCYDIAKAKYVNLLMSQTSKEKRHGDDKLMIQARKNFLEKGYYNILLKEILSVTEKFLYNGCAIADIGCGEGWYTDNIYNFAKSKVSDVKMAGIDISKAAAAALAKRNSSIEAAAASAKAVPIGSGSCDICLSVFAPYDISEIKRILKNGGHFIRVYPLEDHLLGLKKIIYDNVYENKLTEKNFDGFEKIAKKEIKNMLRLENNEDIINLFMMTPYYYKTSRADQEKIRGLTSLDTEIEFGIDVYRSI